MPALAVEGALVVPRACSPSAGSALRGFATRRTNISLRARFAAESLPRTAGARAAARPGTFGLPRRRHAARTYVLGLPRDIAKRRTDGEEEEGQEGQVAS